MLHETSVDRYSSVVTLQLLVGGQVYPLAQTAPDFVILKSPATLHAGPATVITVVDGDERRRDVELLASEGPCDTIRIRLA